MGPILEQSGTSINVLGQWFEIGEIDGAMESLEGSLFKSAYVEAQIDNDELQVVSLQVLNEYSIPGVSAIFVSGIVTESSSQIGKFVIGDITIDALTTLVGEPYPEVGDYVTVSGTQAVMGGEVQASTIL